MPARYCERCGQPVEFCRSHDCTSKNALTERGEDPPTPTPTMAASGEAPGGLPPRSVSAFTKLGAVPARESATTDAQRALTASDGPDTPRVEPVPLTPGSATSAAPPRGRRRTPFNHQIIL